MGWPKNMVPQNVMVYQQKTDWNILKLPFRRAHTHIHTFNAYPFFSIGMYWVFWYLACRIVWIEKLCLKKRWSPRTGPLNFSHISYINQPIESSMLQSQFSWWIVSFCDQDMLRYVKIPSKLSQKNSVRKSHWHPQALSHHPTTDRQVGADTEQAIDGGATPLIVAAYKVRCGCFFPGRANEDWWPNFMKSWVTVVLI